MNLFMGGWLWLRPDPDRIAFALRTAAATWLAVALATLLQIPNAQWAGITVFVVAQPTRGMLIEKGLYRLVGSLIGTAAGVAMLLAFAGQPLAMVSAMAAWLGVCAAAGALLRHFRSYGAVLAGYTAAIVALLAFEHPETIRALAWGRVASTLIGIAAAMVVMSFTAPSPVLNLLRRARRSGADVIVAAATHLIVRRPRAGIARALAQRICEIDLLADDVLGGALTGDLAKRRLRDYEAAQLALMSATRALRARIEPLRRDPEVAGWALDLARALRALANRSGEPARHRLAVVMAILRAAPPVVQGLVERPANELFEAVEALVANQRILSGEAPPEPAMQASWSSAQGGLRAAIAGVRTAATVLTVGFIWLATGWQAGPIMLLGACVMIAAFSSNEDSQNIIRKVLAGIVVGVGAALLFRLVLLPFGAPVWLCLLALLPFLALSALGLASRVLMTSAVEYNNIFLLLSQPNHLSAVGAPLPEMGLAIVLGVFAALVAYHLVLPFDVSRSRAILRMLMVRDLEHLGAHAAARSPAVWRARQYHRLLRYGAPPAAAPAGVESLEGPLTALDLGNLLMRLSEESARSPEDYGALVDLIRRAYARFGEGGEIVAQTLEDVAARLELRADQAASAVQRDRGIANELRQAAARIRQTPAFWTIQG